MKLYLTTIKTILEQLNSTKDSKWIREKFFDIFLDKLPSKLSLERKIAPEIFLHSNSSSQFREIFRLFSMKLQKLRKQLDTLIRDEKISSSISFYEISILFAKKKNDKLQSSHVYRLSSIQLSNNQKSLCIISNRRSSRSIIQHETIQQNRSHEWLLTNRYNHNKSI